MNLLRKHLRLNSRNQCLLTSFSNLRKCRGAWVAWSRASLFLNNGVKMAVITVSFLCFPLIRKGLNIAHMQHSDST